MKPRWLRAGGLWLAVAASAWLSPGTGWAQAPPRSGGQTALRAAESLLQRGKPQEAEAYARSAVEQSPRSAAAHNLLGTVYSMLGRATEAETEYRTALDLESGLVIARTNLGNLLLQQRRLEEARAEFETVLRSDPRNPKAQYLLGEVLMAQGHFSEAADHFAVAGKLSQGANENIALLQFVSAALRGGRTEEGLRAADELTHLGARDSRVLFNLALVLGEGGQYERAVKLFRRVDSLRPNAPEVLFN
ncbi:MAG: tetratricopeptide repeat protein, partial [Terriglobales bacterium]